MVKGSEAALRGRIGGFSLAAKRDPKEYTRPARAAFESRFVAQVDPDAVLPEPERIRRAEAARRAYYARLAYQSAASRRRRGGGAPTPAESTADADITRRSAAASPEEKAP
jgi:hypothetical protein